MLMPSTIDTLRTLDAITPDDRGAVGGKAYNCAMLKQAGFPVPDGLAILADADDDQVRLLALDPWIQALPADTRFAVRSSGLGEDSAGDSFAGIHETKLNVLRDELVDAVLACRRSAQSDQARAYPAARGLDQTAARPARLGQLMVPAPPPAPPF